MSWNGKGEVESREPMGLRPAGPATKPIMEYLTCEICGQRMSERHCKLVCPNCGYTRDCSDP